MKSERVILCIDVGSNSIRCMEAAGSVDAPRFSDKRVFTTRLAEGLAQTNRLSETRMRQSLDVLDTLAREAHSSGVVMRAYATSAVRDAENRDAFLHPAASILGHSVDVLTGVEEAANAYRAATGERGGGMLDLGGGSTQIIRPPYAESFPLGCVRARDRFPGTSFPSLLAQMRPLIAELYRSVPAFSPCDWTGVGGTITTLGALLCGLTTYDKTRVQGYVIQRMPLIQLLNNLSVMGDDARAQMPLLAARHDVILQGGALLCLLLERIGCERLRVSDADGLEGYALSLLAEQNA